LTNFIFFPGRLLSDTEGKERGLVV
jgi:hypothetical protein